MEHTKDWARACLKNISQVILIENPYAGLLILLGIAVSSWKLGLIALAAAILATAAAHFLKADQNLTKQGLLGFNAILTSMALYLFMTGPNKWWIALLGACIAVVVTGSMMHLFKSTALPALTFPFIILTWFMLLTAYRLHVFQLTSDLVPQFLSHQKLTKIAAPDWPEALINGYGQIFFIDHNISCLLILAAIFLANWKTGLLTIMANLTALAVAFLFGGDSVLIGKGLYGYNAILSAIAVSAAFPPIYQSRKVITGFIVAVLSVLITASVSAFLLPYGLPALTMPFVLTTWLVLAARKILPGL